jgi:hypothetical protein
MQTPTNPFETEWRFGGHQSVYCAKNTEDDFSTEAFKTVSIIALAAEIDPLVSFLCWLCHWMHSRDISWV